MARHGYLGDYDQAPTSKDNGSRPLRDEERDWDKENRDFLFGGRGRDRDQDRDRQRGFFGSISNQARELGAFGGHGGWERAPRGFSSNQDDLYLRWRDKQIEALDRDYAEYCREREQQFHQDFDSWRRDRQQISSSRDQDELLLTTPRPSGASMTTGAAVEPTTSAKLDSAVMPGARPGGTGDVER